MLKSHSHYTRNLHDWHQEGKKKEKKERPPKKNHRGSMSALSHKRSLMR